MVLRGVNEQDFPRLTEIHSYYGEAFPLNLSNTFAHCVAQEKDRIIGFGWLQLIVEASVILDVKSKLKFHALNQILNQGKFEAKKAGFDQVHAFPKDERFSQILKKHYGFSDVTGDALVMNLE